MEAGDSFGIELDNNLPQFLSNLFDASLHRALDQGAQPVRRRLQRFHDDAPQHEFRALQPPGVALDEGHEVFRHDIALPQADKVLLLQYQSEPLVKLEHPPLDRDTPAVAQALTARWIAQSAHMNSNSQANRMMIATR